MMLHGIIACVSSWYYKMSAIYIEIHGYVCVFIYLCNTIKHQKKKKHCITLYYKTPAIYIYYNLYLYCFTNV